MHRGPKIGQVRCSMWLQGLSSCGRCLSPADTPSCRGRTCCLSSAWWGPAGGGHGTISPRAKGYSWAPLLWQPFSTAAGPLLHPVRGSKDRSAQPGCEITAGSGRGEGKERWRTSWHREVTANSMPATRILLWLGPAETTRVHLNEDRVWVSGTWNNCYLYNLSCNTEDIDQKKQLSLITIHRNLTNNLSNLRKQKIHKILADCSMSMMFCVIIN